MSELRLFQQQQPYLVWGTNRSNKERLLRRSWRKLYQQSVAFAMAMVFVLAGVVWWHTPWGQIQQVRWELASLSKQVGDRYKVTAVRAFFKDENLKQSLAITDSIKDLFYKADVLTDIAQTYGQLENFSQADKYLTQAITAAQQIDDLGSKAYRLIAIAQTYGQLKNFTAAGQYLTQAITDADQIDRSLIKADLLISIIKIQVEEHDRWQRVHPTGWRQAHNTVLNVLEKIAE